MGSILNWTSAALKPANVGAGKICREVCPDLMRRK